MPRSKLQWQWHHKHKHHSIQYPGFRHNPLLVLDSALRQLALDLALRHLVTTSPLHHLVHHQWHHPAHRRLRRRAHRTAYQYHQQPWVHHFAKNPSSQMVFSRLAKLHTHTALYDSTTSGLYSTTGCSGDGSGTGNGERWVTRDGG